MTTEVVVMNREAVALAADSAATINDSKIFNSVDKIFMLSADCPIGIMVYGNSTFMSLPWEIVIKLFRDYLTSNSVSKVKLEDYVNEFIKFLNDNSSILSTIDQQGHLIAELAVGLFEDITKNIWARLENFIYITAQKIDESTVISETKSEIKDYLDIFEDLPDFFSDQEIPKIIQDYQDTFGNFVSDMMIQYFDQLPLDDEDKNNLFKLCYYQIIKKVWSGTNSGVVFVGYGKNDLLPKCLAIDIEYFIFGKLKYRIVDERSGNIEFDGHPALVIPFAQDDVVHNILFGVHPEYLSALGRNLNKHLDEGKVKEVLDNTFEDMRSNYSASIYQAIFALPKEDLAVVAETLVNLTSFMRKVSMNPETVGGPIDVALISKYDGFIWIKRKHYYNNIDNPHLRAY